jgi:muramoyltetrapeptide carboxypeptidase LdcA involved in peptidoglycan recycling
LGGHIFTLTSLTGTTNIPWFTDSFVLFLETNEEFNPQLFEKNLQSLIQQPWFSNIQWLVVWRFQHKTKMTRTLLEKILLSKPELGWIPIIANVDFWHTMPFLTFPIWGNASIDTSNKEYIMIDNH